MQFFAEDEDVKPASETIPLPSASDEIHIAGVVVHTRPETVEIVKKSIPLIPHAEVHASSDDGRIVVTLETRGTQQTLDYMDAIRALPGVLNVALVYQHAESASAFDEVIDT